MSRLGAILIAAALLAMPVPALAHKVIVSVYVAGGMIEGEIGFSDGIMAKLQKVVVTDGQGTPLGEAVTDDTGFFTFAPVGAVDHHFRADLGSGHVAQALVAAADLSGGAMPSWTMSSTASGQSQPGGAAPGTAAVSEAVLARIVREEMRPLRRQITALKEKNGLRDILAGIGLIAGLFGLGFYLAAKRQIAAAPRPTAHREGD